MIASGRSQRHVAALADHLLRALKDCGPEVRSFYQIEKIWSVDSPHRGLSAN